MVGFMAGLVWLGGCEVRVREPSPRADGLGTYVGIETGTDTGLATCGEGLVCVPDPGPEWEGPIARGEVCTGAYPNEGGVWLVEPQLPLSCDCACDPAETTCPSSVIVWGYDESSCVDLTGGNNASPGECFEAFGSDVLSTGVELGDAVVTCGTGTVVETRPAPTFDAQVRTCEPASMPEPGSCEADEQCAPLPGGELAAGICAWRPGEVDCPTGFPERTVVVRSIDDQRTCPNACSCTTVPGQCEVEVQGFSNSTCGFASGAPVILGSGQTNCIRPFGGGALQPGPISVAVPGACTPERLVASGSLALDVATVCCTE